MNLSRLSTPDLLTKRDQLLVEIDRRKQSAAAELALLQGKQKPIATARPPAMEKDELIVLITQTVSIVSETFAVHSADIVGESKAQDVITARYATWLILRNLGVPFPQLAKAFKREHAAIVYACGKASEKFHADTEFSDLVTAITHKLKA